jgi:hypothetical protein
MSVVVEAIFGALYHRLLLRSGPLDAAYAAYAASGVDLVFAGSATARSSGSAGQSG